MYPIARLTLYTSHASPPFPHKGPGQENPEDNEGLELPVNPDQGMPLIPNEEGEVNIPA